MGLGYTADVSHRAYATSVLATNGTVLEKSLKPGSYPVTWLAHQASFLYPGTIRITILKFLDSGR
jgi:hypothetical protein